MSERAVLMEPATSGPRSATCQSPPLRHRRPGMRAGIDNRGLV